MKPCCGQARPPSPTLKPPAHQDQMLYTTTHKTVTGLDGINHPVGALMIKPEGKPKGGWAVTLPVKGQAMEIPGRNPEETFRNARIIATRNSISISDDDLWLNLNIVWMLKTDARHHKVQQSDLMIAATAAPSAIHDHRQRKYLPQQWGAVAWKWLGLYLARDVYHFRDFLFQAEVVLDMLNPHSNPSLGCIDCYREFARHVEELKKNPGTDHFQARQWLFNTHNLINTKLGKSVLTFDQASLANYWK